MASFGTRDNILTLNFFVGTKWRARVRGLVVSITWLEMGLQMLARRFSKCCIAGNWSGIALVGGGCYMCSPADITAVSEVACWSPRGLRSS